MEGLICGVSVDKYIGENDDGPFECDSDTIEREVIEKTVMVTVPMSWKNHPRL